MPPGPSRIKVNRSYTYGWVYGGGSGTVKGSTGDWRAGRGGTIAAAMTDTLTSGADVLKYFDSDHASFDANPIWIYFPLWEAGYSRAFVAMYNNLGVVLTVTAYLVPVNAPLVGSVMPLDSGAFYDPIGGVSFSYALGDAGSFRIAIGVDSDNIDANRIATAACGGGLLVKADPASDPGAGKDWQIGCMRGW